MSSTGTLLEDFSELLFNSINGFSVRYKRAKARATSSTPEHDYDLVIHNTSNIFTEFGNYILVECKDWKDPVGYPEIAKFLHKLHSRKCNLGIIVAMSNVVEKDFNTTLRRTFDQDNIAVIVLDKDDLTKILAKQVVLTTLLRKKYEKIRFGFYKK